MDDRDKHENLFGDISSSSSEDESDNESETSRQIPFEDTIMTEDDSNYPIDKETLDEKKKMNSFHVSISAPNLEDMNSNSGFTPIKRARLPSTKGDDIFEALGMLDDANSCETFEKPPAFLNLNKVTKTSILHKSATVGGNLAGLDILEELDDAGDSFRSTFLQTTFEGLIDDQKFTGNNKEEKPSNLNDSNEDSKFDTTVASEMDLDENIKDNDTTDDEEAEIKRNDEDEIIHLKTQLLVGNLDKDQLDRYEAYKRSCFPRSVIKRLIQEATKCTVNVNVVITIAGMAKVFVSELVEEALDIQEALGDTGEPLLPKHLELAYQTLQEQGKLFGCKGFRKNPFS
ncbi:Transcription initiation factor TFIID subunit 11 [Strongyloides ratti]|uniref:Transcription initiation factor TFIID subunit 11 n=1 Tax=Strongyloides ratti TaxID=34506 RepID=A0A090LFD5_STRRB|nr:Transcription initiation factor TFIID subunit 11 [Strongyloides ratti]CEF68482.1 Transcription initiation factor TFIID subunit 11 [Strongyloides ratti]